MCVMFSAVRRGGGGGENTRKVVSEEGEKLAQGHHGKLDE